MQCSGCMKLEREIESKTSNKIFNGLEEKVIQKIHCQERHTRESACLTLKFCISWQVSLTRCMFFALFFKLGFMEKR